MTTVERDPQRSGIYAKGWAQAPDVQEHQLTHAVERGFRIALCGVSTTTYGSSWPLDATSWDSPLGRCPTCARVVYGPFDRRG